MNDKAKNLALCYSVAKPSIVQELLKLEETNPSSNNNAGKNNEKNSFIFWNFLRNF